MYDPLPDLTNFLLWILQYMVYIGIILSGVSGIVAGLLLLPIFGIDDRRTAIGFRALFLAGFGLFIILTAIPLRGIILHFFPAPAGVPVEPTPPPMLTPTPLPTPTPTP